MLATGPLKMTRDEFYNTTPAEFNWLALGWQWRQDEKHKDMDLLARRISIYTWAEGKDQKDIAYDPIFDGFEYNKKRKAYSPEKSAALDDVIERARATEELIRKANAARKASTVEKANNGK